MLSLLLIAITFGEAVALREAGGQALLTSYIYIYMYMYIYIYIYTGVYINTYILITYSGCQIHAG